MSFLNRLLGDDDDKLEDKEVAQDMIKDSKFSISALSLAVSEAVNPELRQMLKQQLDQAVNEHFELADAAVNKGWYPAQDEPIEQLKRSYEKSQRLTE